jgi:hypothetical protein
MIRAKKREKPMTVSKIEAFKNSNDVGISGREWLRGRR